MKKTLITLALVSTMSMAMATDVGVRAGAYDTGSSKAALGVVVSQHLNGKLVVEGTVTRVNVEAAPTNFGTDRYGVAVGYDVAKFGAVTITPKVGVAYIQTEASGPFDWLSRNGYAATVGIGASLPITKAVKVGVDYQYTKGQDKIKFVDGSAVFATVSYSF